MKNNMYPSTGKHKKLSDGELLDIYEDQTDTFCAKSKSAARRIAKSRGVFSELGTRFAVVTREGEKVNSCSTVKIKSLFLRGQVDEMSPVMVENEDKWLKIADVFNTNLWAGESDLTKREFTPGKSANVSSKKSQLKPLVKPTKDKPKTKEKEQPEILVKNHKTQPNFTIEPQSVPKVPKSASSIFAGGFDSLDESEKKIVESISTWSVLSLISALFCGLGFVAAVYGIRAFFAKRKEEYTDAIYYIGIAKNWAIASYIIGVLLLVGRLAGPN